MHIGPIGREPTTNILHSQRPLNIQRKLRRLWSMRRVGSASAECYYFISDEIQQRSKDVSLIEHHTHTHTHKKTRRTIQGWICRNARN